MARTSAPRRLARPEHSISRRNIDVNALKVLSRLDRAGHDACLVGGGVRDLLLDREPKDYDIATSATPDEIRSLFRNSRIIGRRFRLAHVYFRGCQIVEVSTFRAAPDREAQRGGPDELLVTDDNVFGTPREDAFRRDFTVNALYYQISDFSIVDHVGGLEDLDSGVIRAIGDPEIRFREDPVRMMRACEMAGRLGFGIESEAQRAMLAVRSELAKAAPPRIREELLQILRCGAAGKAFQWMLDLGLLELLMPEMHAIVEAQSAGIGNFEGVVSVLDGGRPARYDDAVILAAVLAPAVLVEQHRRRTRAARRRGEGPEGDRAPGRVREVVTAATADFVERFAVPNATRHRMHRILEIVLRLIDPPEDRWQRRRVTTYVAFDEAMQVFNVLVKATGEGRDTLTMWRAAARDKTEIPASARPRRRRRRRRRRPKRA